MPRPPARDYAAAATGTVTSTTGLGPLSPAVLRARTRMRTVAPGANTRSPTVSCNVTRLVNGPSGLVAISTPYQSARKLGRKLNRTWPGIPPSATSADTASGARKSAGTRGQKSSQRGSPFGSTASSSLRDPRKFVGKVLCDASRASRFVRCADFALFSVDTAPSSAVTCAPAAVVVTPAVAFWCVGWLVSYVCNERTMFNTSGVFVAGMTSEFFLKPA